MIDLVESRAREDEPAPPKGLRDEFAKAAMPIAYARVGENEHGWHGIAKVAYMIADAMLEARR